MKKTRAWRLSHKRFSGDPFSGNGARIYGGRFNSEGRSVIYTSGGLSLAILELLVRVPDPEYLSSFIFYHADIPDELITKVQADELPDGWDALPYKPVSQTLGDEWLHREVSAVLKVPSVIVPSEHNYLINPHHPHFKKINYSEAEDFSFDRRLVNVFT